MEERILELAMTLGRIVEGDEEMLCVLCDQVCIELGQRLRTGVTQEDCAEAFALAGAWLALANYYATDDGISQFTAGDLTVQHREGTARCAALRMQAEQIIRPYVQDENFAFLGV